MPDAAETTGSEIVVRVVVSFVACAMITWQLAETANFRSDAMLAADRLKSRCNLGGTALQWYLVALMFLSALDGLILVGSDLYLLGSDSFGSGRSVGDLGAVRQELTIHLVLGKLSQLLLSLMIIGLGADGLRRGAGAGAKLALALGCLSLVIQRLPPPLVLVAGCFVVQRSKPPKRGRRGDDDARGSVCSLRCALRPLLALALLEAYIASVPLSAEVERNLDKSKHDMHIMIDHELERHQRVLSLRAAHGDPNAAAQAKAEQANAREFLDLLDTLTPAALFEMAQQQLGEVVMVGTVLVLGISGRAHGLKGTLWPIVAAFCPGLPTSFAVIFYFLLETRQAQEGGTLLPLSSAGPTVPTPPAELTAGYEY